MNKVTIKGFPFKLNGEIISKGESLNFSALDKDGKRVFLKDFKGKVIISTFPDINTRICDEQTQKIVSLANVHKDITFLSITTDGPEIIKDWCAANDVENISIVTDDKLEFANATNTFITKIKKLARGFIIVEDNKILEISYKKEIASDPDYDLLNKYI